MIILQQLAGHNVEFICNDFASLRIYCHFDTNKMEFSLTKPDTVSCTISAPLYGYINLLIAKDQADIRSSGIVITGDHEIARKVQRYFFSFDLDWWEEQLSKYSGDVIANRTLKAFRKARSYQQQSYASLEQMVVEYLQNEAQMLPTAIEVDHFNEEVDELRLQVDRLAARLALLKAREQQHESP